MDGVMSDEKSIMNALRADMALGCSTNSVLHITAIANEAKVDMNLDIINDLSSSIGSEAENLMTLIQQNYEKAPEVVNNLYNKVNNLLGRLL